MKPVDRQIAGAAVWLRRQMEEAGADGYVVGISGGVDSAVAARLASLAEVRVFGLLMPCYSVKEDMDRAVQVAKWTCTDYMTCDLDLVYSSCMNTMYVPRPTRALDLAKANLKARLRMVTLYFFANSMNYLVLGTSNRTELELGYFTKYGDGGVDVEPLGFMYKRQVYQIAERLHVPVEVMKAAPSAGLWEGQTDENEIGVVYEQIDKVLCGTWDYNDAPLPQDIVSVEAFRDRADHKLMMPPIFKLNSKDYRGG